MRTFKKIHNFNDSFIGDCFSSGSQMKVFREGLMAVLTVIAGHFQVNDGVFEQPVTDYDMPGVIAI